MILEAMGKTVRYLSDSPEFDVHEARSNERERNRHNVRSKKHLKQMARDAVRESVDDMMGWGALDSHYLWSDTKERRRRS